MSDSSFHPLGFTSGGITQTAWWLSYARFRSTLRLPIHHYCPFCGDAFQKSGGRFVVAGFAAGQVGFGIGKLVAELIRKCGLDKQRDLFAGDTLEIYDPRYFCDLASLGKLSS